MENKKTDKRLDEHITKIMFRSGYKINETPKYKPLIDDNMEFDELPQEVYATQDGFPIPNVGGSEAYLEEEDDNVDTDNDFIGDEVIEDGSEIESNKNDIETEKGDIENKPEIDINVDPSTEIQEPVEQEKNVDEIQNEIIKHNISAMQDLHNKIKELDSFVNNVNSQLDTLNAKVKEVEEPTNAEKLMSQKEVSFPFYFNLNDYWKGSHFDQQMVKSNNNGIKELPDGTYIADFDDLPRVTDSDLEDSFNKFV